MGTYIDNPWTYLPTAEPFVLESDRQAVSEFNTKARDEFKLRLELLPEPYWGNPNAKVVLLNLNPGFSDDDVRLHRTNAEFVECCRRSLLQEEQEYPAFYLNPAFSDTPGYRWCQRKLGALVNIVGRKKVANGIFCIEFFPYHSNRYKRMRSILPSQHYSFHLVREAIRRGALMIMLRGKRGWLTQVPELVGYPFYTLNSAQSGVISPRNLPAGFDDIVKALEQR
jgi:hypothetical protein